ncbi:MAG: NUDIX hydrolase [Chloroflexota bacterium]|nr:NUDIX hydrolase [Chloroflexota bacterium]
MSRQIATLIRRFPALIRLPFLIFRRLQSRYTVGVAGVVLNEEGRVLIVEHAYHPRYPWGLPGGWIGEDEDPAEAILRELREELQLAAEVTRVLHTSKPFRNHIDMSFLCNSLSPIGKLSMELLDFCWADPDNLPDLHEFHCQSIKIAVDCGRRGDKWERN